MSRSSRSPRAVLATTVPVSAAMFLPQLIIDLSRDHEVHVVSSPGALLDDLAMRFAVVTHPIPMTRGISAGADFLAFCRWVVILLRLRPSVVVSMTPKASLLSMLAGWLVRVPRRVYLLVGLRLEGESGRLRRLLAQTERVTALAANVVVANSPSLCDAAVEEGLVPRSKISTSRPGSSHGVDTDHFHPRPADRELAVQLGLQPGSSIVGFVGRVTHDKGLDTLLAASTLMSERGATHQLLIIGGHDESDSATYLRRLRDAENVVLVEHAPDVRPYYALMDVHVLPTLREGFPNVVLEASAMEVATVTTRATGAVDSVRDAVTGLLVSPGAPEELAEAVCALLDDPERRIAMGAAARDWVSDQFKPRMVTRSVLEAAGIR